jgi:hypothetical protein
MTIHRFRRDSLGDVICAAKTPLGSHPSGLGGSHESGAKIVIELSRSGVILWHFYEAISKSYGVRLISYLRLSRPRVWRARSGEMVGPDFNGIQSHPRPYTCFTKTRASDAGLSGGASLGLRAAIAEPRRTSIGPRGGGGARFGTTIPDAERALPAVPCTVSWSTLCTSRENACITWLVSSRGATRVGGGRTSGSGGAAAGEIGGSSGIDLGMKLHAQR